MRGTSFIVIEGLDGSGTTTQARLLAQALRRRGTGCLLTFEPTDSPVGKLIRDSLAGRIVSGPEPIRFSEKALCLLFAADRLEHSRLIEQALADGAWVVCDRYILSSLAYQTLDPTIDTDWVITVNQGCSTPHLTILLKVGPDECTARLRSRRGKPSLYENSSTLASIAANYQRVLPCYRRVFGEVVELDGTGSRQEVHGRIMDLIADRLGSG